MKKVTQFDRTTRDGFPIDRPLIAGVVGRTGGRLQLTIAQSANSKELVSAVQQASHPGSIISTDEWNGYRPIAHDEERTHWRVDHSGRHIFNSRRRGKHFAGCV